MVSTPDSSLSSRTAASDTSWLSRSSGSGGAAGCSSVGSTSVGASPVAGAAMLPPKRVRAASPKTATGTTPTPVVLAVRQEEEWELPKQWAGSPSYAVGHIFGPLPVQSNNLQPIRRPLMRVSMNAINFRHHRFVDIERNRESLGIGMTLYEIYNASWESLESYMTKAEYPKNIVGTVRSWWNAETRRVQSNIDRKITGPLRCPNCKHEFLGRSRGVVEDY